MVISFKKKRDASELLFLFGVFVSFISYVIFAVAAHSKHEEILISFFMRDSLNI